MLKLLLCLLCSVALAVTVLQLRQQKLELLHQCSRLHAQMKELQIELWNQQLRIATATAPMAIRQTVEHYDLTLVPSNAGIPHLDDPAGNPDAE